MDWVGDQKDFKKADNVSYPYIKVSLNNLSYYIDLDQNTRWRDMNQLGHRWLTALKKNLKNKLILEKNYCFLGFADSKRNIDFLCDELNKAIKQINDFSQDWEFRHFPKIDIKENYTRDDFMHSDTFGLRLKHEACNELHKYFEDLQGQAWNLSPYYRSADHETKYAIRQLNNLCHEIEGWVNANRKKAFEPEWIRPSQITTFLNAPRYNLLNEDYDFFKHNRYDRELGGVYLHWSQVGKTLFEVFRDGDEDVGEGGINHQQFYSGEFDIEWGQTINENTFDWKKEEMDEFRTWLKNKNYDWNDPKLALGYIKLGQVNLEKSFGTKNFLEIYNKLSNNLNITKIEVIEGNTIDCEYSYSLENPDWKQIQIESLKKGYESYSMR